MIVLGAFGYVLALVAAGGWLAREIVQGRALERLMDEADELHGELSDEHSRAVRSLMEVGALKRDRNVLAEENLKLRNRLRELETAKDQLKRLGSEREP